MSPKKKDASAQSLPSYKNVRVESLDRQINVRKATLGEKLALMQIFSQWVAELAKAGHLTAKDRKELDESEQNAKQGIQFISEHLPVVLGYIAKDYATVLVTCTDINDGGKQDLERLTDLGELVEVFKAIWEINSFEKDLVKMGKVLGDLGLGVSLAPTKG